MDLLAPETIEAIKVAGATAAELRKAALLTNDVKRAMVALNQDSTVAARKNLEGAEKAQSVFVGGLVDQYINGIGNKKAERFSSRREAHAWVVSQGVSVSSSKFYEDCAAGLIQVSPDKTVSKWQVSQYLIRLLQESAPTASNAVRQEEIDEYKLRKLKAEVKEIELRYREADREWMRTDDAWAAVAALLASFCDNLQYQFHQAQGVLVHLTGGDISRQAEGYEECLAVIGRARNDLAGATIEGIFSTDIGNEGIDGAI